MFASYFSPTNHFNPNRILKKSAIFAKKHLIVLITRRKRLTGFSSTAVSVTSYARPSFVFVSAEKQRVS